MLHAYVAIQIAAEITEPLAQADIDRALEEFLSSRDRLGESDFDSILALRKELAEIYWLQRVNEILERKLAAKENPYSYDAVIYRTEASCKEPISSGARLEFAQLAAELEQSERKLDEYIDEKASCDAAEAALQRMVAEVEAEQRAEANDR
jgi:hypothetical protein